MPRLESDILALMRDACDGALDPVPLRWSPATALTVVLAARGYPGPIEKGSEIRGIDAAEAVPGARVFHAGTREEHGRLTANGGRVLNVTALGSTVSEAQARAYAAVDQIAWREGFCRRDIGWRAVARESR
jgi:phosphoribosylamine--glycine ligase